MCASSLQAQVRTCSTGVCPDIILQTAMQDPASAPYQRGASSAATGDASQLGSTASASQPGVTGPHVQLNIGTFNFGAAQSMFAGNNCNKRDANLQRVVGNMVGQEIWTYSSDARWVVANKDRLRRAFALVTSWMAY
jgi:hypothetical protein